MNTMIHKYCTKENNNNTLKPQQHFSCQYAFTKRSEVRADLVVFAEQLHADHGEDEDDDGEDERQVSQSAHGVTDDFYQGVECRPWAGQLENTKLEAKDFQNKSCS